MKKQPRLLIVGAFPQNRKGKVFGGQVSACMKLLDSSLVTRFDLHTLDTTQISNPPPHFAIRMIFALWRVIFLFFKLIGGRFDAVMIFAANGASVYEKGLMVRLCNLFNIPALVFPRAGELIASYSASNFFATVVRKTFGHADMFLCQGKGFQDFAVSKLGFDAEHAPIIPNWTALEEHLAIGRCKVAGYQNGKDTPHKNRVLFLGWLEEFKGVFELLEAAKLLSDHALDFHLTFAGDGNAMEPAKKFVVEHDLQQKISFVGWIDGKDKAALLKSHSIFVLPSWNEGLPNAMIEALSSGLACVVTDVGMIGDYVNNGQDAFITKPKDVADLTSALQALLSDDDLCRNMAINGQLLAQKTFHLQNGTDLIADAVLKVCDKGPKSTEGA